MDKKKPLALGLLAHVDAGKTTLSEALLYTAGALRNFGRVDHKDAFLDTHGLERQRGITIFSKQALLETRQLEITLVDTPGHVDFSTEAERVMPILDCALLVISGTNGIQAHTLTLWQLLQRYNIPVFLFVNKTDLPGVEKAALLTQLQQRLDMGCTDLEALPEAAAMCDEDLLEAFLETGAIPVERIQALISQRKLFPCCFGSALKLEGISQLLDTLDRFAPRAVYPEAFSAKVFKISYDEQGTRLTWLKLTGGTLLPRILLSYRDKSGNEKVEKTVQLRRYSGDKFQPAQAISPGQLCAVAGLSATYAGQGLGNIPDSLLPATESIMTYRVVLPQGCDPVTALQKLQQLEEEDPQLQLDYLPQAKQIHVQLMGKIQLEILRDLILQRFNMAVTFDSGHIQYKETILSPVEGVGHFEPLRHYAEVHLLLEPLPPGSGLIFDSQCPTDVLESHYQNLVLTHLAEKRHLGVLTGAPITDMKISLLVGKAHNKHTEGGDFRQATYRAIRQGLMQAESQLLEPWYAFSLRVPTEHIGRAITDMRQMAGTFNAPEADGTYSILTGKVPAATLSDYPSHLLAYTKGLGQLQLNFHGYLPCHNPEAVIAEVAYAPESDLENTPDSVFCDHGAGITVKWNQITEFMHLDSGWHATPPECFPKP